MSSLTSFDLHTEDIRLIKHQNCVYKVKVICNGIPEAVTSSLQSAADYELEQIFRAVVYAEERGKHLSLIETSNFFVSFTKPFWKTSEKLGLKKDGQPLNLYPHVLVFRVFLKEDSPLKLKKPDGGEERNNLNDNEDDGVGHTSAIRNSLPKNSASSDTNSVPKNSASADTDSVRKNSGSSQRNSVRGRKNSVSHHKNSASADRNSASCHKKLVCGRRNSFCRENGVVSPAKKSKISRDVSESPGTGHQTEMGAAQSRLQRYVQRNRTLHTTCSKRKQNKSKITCPQAVRKSPRFYPGEQTKLTEQVGPDAENIEDEEVKDGHTPHPKSKISTKRKKILPNSKSKACRSKSVSSVESRNNQTRKTNKNNSNSQSSNNSASRSKKAVFISQGDGDLTEGQGCEDNIKVQMLARSSLPRRSPRLHRQSFGLWGFVETIATPFKHLIKRK